mmetsp:Transcript_101465/g.176119  ORF Transcript_101465/g.176119 Transcript_101465/m.176119 type:complete len:242 (+) Transcript_101465:254-979(+)
MSSLSLQVPIQGGLQGAQCGLWWLRAHGFQPPEHRAKVNSLLLQSGTSSPLLHHLLVSADPSQCAVGDVANCCRGTAGRLQRGLCCCCQRALLFAVPLQLKQRVHVGGLVDLLHASPEQPYIDQLHLLDTIVATKTHLHHGNMFLVSFFWAKPARVVQPRSNLPVWVPSLSLCLSRCSHLGLSTRLGLSAQALLPLPRRDRPLFATPRNALKQGVHSVEILCKSLGPLFGLSETFRASSCA